MEDIQAEGEIKKSAKPKKKAKPKAICDAALANNMDLQTKPQVKAKPKRKPKIKSNAENANGPKIKKPRKKRGSQASDQTTSDISSDVTKTPNGKKQVGKRKRKVKSQEEHIQIGEDIENIEEGPSNETIDWPQSDLSELIKRMQLALPEKDNLAFGTRAEKLNWNDIAFGTYSGEDCKKTWFLIQKRLRRFRLLREVLQDAKEWISKPWTNFYRGNKNKRHPDMPRRPLSVYMVFYLKKKDKIVAENPGIEMTELSKLIAQMYKTISPAKREKYMQMAAEERKTYEEKLQEFYRLHPEMSRCLEKPTNNKPTEVGPKQPSTPFGLYFEHQLKNFASDSEGDRNSFKEQCKEQWKNMSDKKKVIWIDWALDQEAKYQDALKNYISQNPNFEPVAPKRVLTKDEKTLKERVAGKPIKPPNSAYGLFSKMMLTSEEIKKIPAKERMKSLADQWKSCTEDEKKQYRERVTHLMEQYKLDFASYLESLPEDKRQEELQNNLPKRKSKGSNEDAEQQPVAKKKKKVVVENNKSEEKAEEDELKKIFGQDPTQPPISGFALFSKRYHGKLPVKTAWKNLSSLEKREYESEVKNLKLKYIKEYEKFLKSLTKTQLTAYSQYKRNRDKALSNTKEDKGLNETNSDSASDSESSGSGSDQE